MNASASVIFVRFMDGTSKKSGKEYQMLEISDGLSSKSFFVSMNQQEVDAARKLERGDRVKVHFNVNIMAERDLVDIISVELE